MEYWDSLPLTVSMAETNYFTLLFYFWFRDTILICDHSLLLFQTSFCQKLLEIKCFHLQPYTFAQNDSFFLFWKTIVFKSDHVFYRPSYDPCSYLCSNEFTLICANRSSSYWRCISHLFLKLHNFLLSVFPGIGFLTTGQGKVAWEMKPKCSQDNCKPE